MLDIVFAKIFKEVKNMKALVIYFSRADENYFGGQYRFIKKGNTEIAAEFIKELTGADLFKVERLVDYSPNYNECIKEAQVEQRKGERPALKSTLKSIDEYDVIFIGAPIYWGTMPQPMFTQLEALDFKGKIVMPFTTHEGSGLAGVVRDITQIAKGADTKSGLAILGSSVNESKPKLERWIKENL